MANRIEFFLAKGNHRPGLQPVKDIIDPASLLDRFNQSK